MKKINKNSIIFSSLVFLAPYIANAQTRVIGIISDVKALVAYFPRIIFGLSLIYFFWGTGQFILNAGDEKHREEGKKRMFWSIIALFVFVSIYGILKLLGQFAGFIPYTNP